MSKSYTELDVWIQSRVLVKSIYEANRVFPKEELFSLVSQMRRSSVSVPSNIAEGIGRNHTKETIQFLHIARGSLYELETQCFISFDLGYVSNLVLDDFLLKIVSCKRLLNGLINYYISKI